MADPIIIPIVIQGIDDLKNFATEGSAWLSQMFAEPTTKAEEFSGELETIDFEGLKETPGGVGGERGGKTEFDSKGVKEFSSEIETANKGMEVLTGSVESFSRLLTTGRLNVAVGAVSQIGESIRGVAERFGEAGEKVGILATGITALIATASGAVLVVKELGEHAAEAVNQFNELAGVAGLKSDPFAALQVNFAQFGVGLETVQRLVRLTSIRIQEEWGSLVHSVRTSGDDLVKVQLDVNTAMRKEEDEAQAQPLAAFAEPQAEENLLQAQARQRFAPFAEVHAQAGLENAQLAIPESELTTQEAQTGLAEQTLKYQAFFQKHPDVQDESRTVQLQAQRQEEQYKRAQLSEQRAEIRERETKGTEGGVPEAEEALRHSQFEPQAAAHGVDEASVALIKSKHAEADASDQVTRSIIALHEALLAQKEFPQKNAPALAQLMGTPGAQIPWAEIPGGDIFRALTLRAGVNPQTGAPDFAGVAKQISGFYGRPDVPEVAKTALGAQVVGGRTPELPQVIEAFEKLGKQPDGIFAPSDQSRELATAARSLKDASEEFRKILAGSTISNELALLAPGKLTIPAAGGIEQKGAQYIKEAADKSTQVAEGVITGFGKIEEAGQGVVATFNAITDAWTRRTPEYQSALAAHPEVREAATQEVAAKKALQAYEEPKLSAAAGGTWEERLHGLQQDPTYLSLQKTATEAGAKSTTLEHNLAEQVRETLPGGATLFNNPVEGSAGGLRDNSTAAAGDTLRGAGEKLSGAGDKLSGTAGALNAAAEKLEAGAAKQPQTTAPSERGAPVGGLASGGLVEGPGGPTDDAVAIHASAGEFVVKTSRVNEIGAENMRAFNDGSIGLASGGWISGAAAAMVGAGTSSGDGMATESRDATEAALGQSEALGGGIGIGGAIALGSEVGNKEVLSDPVVQGRLKASDARKQQNFSEHGWAGGSWKNLRESFGYADGGDVDDPHVILETHEEAAASTAFASKANEQEARAKDSGRQTGNYYAHPDAGGKQVYDTHAWLTPQEATAYAADPLKFDFSHTMHEPVSQRARDVITTEHEASQAKTPAESDKILSHLDAAHQSEHEVSVQREAGHAGQFGEKTAPTDYERPEWLREALGPSDEQTQAAIAGAHTADFTPDQDKLAGTPHWTNPVKEGPWGLLRTTEMAKDFPGYPIAEGATGQGQGRQWVGRGGEWQELPGGRPHNRAGDFRGQPPSSSGGEEDSFGGSILHAGSPNRNRVNQGPGWERSGVTGELKRVSPEEAAEESSASPITPFEKSAGAYRSLPDLPSSAGAQIPSPVQSADSDVNDPRGGLKSQWGTPQGLERAQQDEEDRLWEENERARPHFTGAREEAYIRQHWDELNRQQISHAGGGLIRLFAEGGEAGEGHASRLKPSIEEHLPGASDLSEDSGGGAFAAAYGDGGSIQEGHAERLKPSMMEHQPHSSDLSLDSGAESFAAAYAVGGEIEGGASRLKPSMTEPATGDLSTDSGGEVFSAAYSVGGIARPLSHESGEASFLKPSMEEHLPGASDLSADSGGETFAAAYGLGGLANRSDGGAGDHLGPSMVESQPHSSDLSADSGAEAFAAAYRSGGLIRFADGGVLKDTVDDFNARMAIRPRGGSGEELEPSTELAIHAEADRPPHAPHGVQHDLTENPIAPGKPSDYQETGIHSGYVRNLYGPQRLANLQSQADMYSSAKSWAENKLSQEGGRAPGERPQIFYNADLQTALAEGGLLQRLFSGGTVGGDQIRFFPGGGPISGPGGPTEDAIPAWLSNGEFVVKASRVAEAGVDRMHDFNSGRIGFAAEGGYFADGGPVDLSFLNNIGSSVTTGMIDPGTVDRGGDGRSGKRDGAYHILDLKTDSVTIRGLPVAQDTLDSIEKSAIGSKLTRAAVNPTWRT